MVSFRPARRSCNETPKLLRLRRQAGIPDPWGWPGWRYFDGIRWTNGYVPYYPAPPQAPAAETPAAKELKELREQNGRLKRLLAEAEMEKGALREVAKGQF
jgi:putative transposase